MRLRLLLLLAVPAIAMVVLASIIVVNRHDAYQDAGAATQVASVARSIADLDEALGDEARSSSQLFLGARSAVARQLELDTNRAQVDSALAILKGELLAEDSHSLRNSGLLDAVLVVEETLIYRDDVTTGRITPLQIADRYAHIRSQVIDALIRTASATSSTGPSSALTDLVAVIESRSVHIDERLAVQLGIRYERWAVGQHSAVIRSIAIQEELLARTLLAAESPDLQVPQSLQSIREELSTTDEVPERDRETAWLESSNEWLAKLDTTVDTETARIADLFEDEENAAATSRTVTVVAVSLTLALAILAAGQVSYRLISRITTITRQAQRLALGRRPDPTSHHVRGNDEIGQLAVTFDEMNERLALATALREAETLVLEGIAHGDPLPDSLDRCARLLGVDQRGDPVHRFTATDPQDGSTPIAESDPGATPLWLVATPGEKAPPVTESHLRAALGLAALAQSRADVDTQLAHQASFDGLTGLLNRRAILERSDVTSATHSSGQHTGFLFLDLDDFKRINDNYGHAVGDAVLVAQSQRILSVCEQFDGAAGRLGGDEFLVILPNVETEQDLEAIAEQFLAPLAEPLRVRDNEFSFTASAGAVLARADVSAESLRHEADIALYEAKNGGRGVAVVASAAMRQRVHASEELRIAFRGALDNGRVVPFFQPIWSENGTVLSGLEALARWRRPRHGIVAPGVFLPIAEELGLLNSVDEALFRHVCEQIVSWRAAGFDVPPVHVNASSVRIEHPQLIASTLSILEETGCPAELVVIEVTESGLMTDLESSSHSLQRLRNHGIRIAADDFGTGYSSLSYLQGLPVDILKVDRQFVDRIDQSPPSQAIVSAVRTLAEALELQIIGEGVEREEELAYLTSIGCGQVQGFLLGRPAPPAETQALLDRIGAPGEDHLIPAMAGRSMGVADAAPTVVNVADLFSGDHGSDSR